jgi:hypothetical protein
MNFKLIRYDYIKNGIFGVLITENFKCETLEHAYADGPNYVPKVPCGTYKCVRGMHRLAGMTQDFETFEITGVEGHSDILFHVGNTNLDTAGCALVGLYRDGAELMSSRVTFNDFMQFLEGVNEFTLEVSNVN